MIVNTRTVCLGSAGSSLPQASGGELIMEMSALLRKFRGRLALIAQDVPQFQVWAGGEKQARHIRANMGMVSYYGGANDPDTIAEIMRESGHYTRWQPGTNPLHEYGIEGNATPMGVPLFHPEEIRGMRQQIVFLMGSGRVCVLPRTSYRDIPHFRARAGVDPHHV